MIGNALLDAVASALAAEFSSVFVGVAQNDEPISLPAITLDLRTSAVVGGPLERGTLTAYVQSQADDTAPADHSDFVLAVSNFLRSLTIATPAVTLAGIVATDAEVNSQERHWISPLAYTVGYYPTA
jgi:hypothetical protein